VSKVNYFNFQTMSVSVNDCVAAMKNADIDDEALVRLFRRCDRVEDLVETVFASDDERGVRLLIAEPFALNLETSFGGTILHVAYEWSTLRTIDMVVDAGVDVDETDEHGAPPWHYAAYNKDKSVIMRLIANGIDVNAVDDIGTSLAHRAALALHTDVLAALIAAGADVNVKDNRGRTVLHDAIEHGCDVAAIAQLIALSDVNAADKNGDTPILLAASSAICTGLDLIVFSMLLDAGADLWAKNSFGDSAFSAALRVRDGLVLAFIMAMDTNATVDVNIVEPDEGCSAMHVAVLFNNHELVARLVAAGGNVNARNEMQQTPLHMFSDGFGDDEAAAVAQLLIDAKADVNAVDFDGRTPCHCVARCGYGKTLETMIVAGASVHARDSRGRTPLFDAQNASAMSVLIAEKSDVNALDMYGNSPCHAMCERGNAEADVASRLALLRAAGAKIDLQNNDGVTPLHVAAERCCIDVLRSLIDAKADVSKRDAKGNTVWHRAVMGGRIENLKFLLDYNGGWNRINVRNAAGETLSHVAASMKRAQTAMVEFLLDAGADPQARTTEGISAFEIALSGGHERIAQRFLQTGAAVRAVNSQGLTACHWAARSPKAAASAVRFLVRAGASVTAISDDGRTPAHFADATALPILRAHGADLNAADNDGNTPCHLFKDSASLAVLFALGANLRATNHTGRTPCAHAHTRRLSMDDDDANFAYMTFAACGAAVGTYVRPSSLVVGAILSVCGASWSPDEYSADTLATSFLCISGRQEELFCKRAFQVCVGLQSLRVSALELCEILSQMFSPLESLVPFEFAWRVVTKVKHFNQ
jgi:ankyrin